MTTPAHLRPIDDNGFSSAPTAVQLALEAPTLDGSIEFVRELGQCAADLSSKGKDEDAAQTARIAVHIMNRLTALLRNNKRVTFYTVTGLINKSKYSEQLRPLV